MTNRLGFADDCPLTRAENLVAHVHRVEPWTRPCAWLVSALLECGCLPDSDDAIGVADAIFRHVQATWPELTSEHQIALAVLLEIDRWSEPQEVWNAGSGLTKWAMTASALDQFRQVLVEHRIDVKAAMRELTEMDREKDVLSVGYTFRARERAKWLLKRDLLSIGETVDPSKVVAFNRSLDWMGCGIDHDGFYRECADIASPALWMDVAPSAFLEWIGTQIPATEDEEAHEWISACLKLSRLADRYSGTTHSLTRESDVQAWAFELIDRRLPRVVKQGHQGLRQTWLRVAMELPGSTYETRSPEQRQRLLSAAGVELGMLRKALRGDDCGTDRDWFEAQRETLHASASMACELGGVWQGVKQLLLLLRELRCKSVGADMRYWGSASDCSEESLEPWNEIPGELIQSFHTYVRRAEESDPELEGFRTEFASFCLQRLKSDPESGELVEPNHTWRWAYARAVRELYRNPGGKGHQVLFHAMNNDPESEVQAVAKKSYEQLRHDPPLPHDRSPRRAITNAMVWLFQAHYLSLSPPGTTLDSKAVEVVREAIARRTTKVKSSVKLDITVT